MDSSLIQQIVVVGGGSAGWLTAGLIAADHGGRVQVTLIESPDVAPNGVGEGTWPSMRYTLRRIGVLESDFLRAADASFKQGSRFDGWVSGSPGDHYYHPFVLPQGFGETDLVAHWQGGHRDVPFADLVSFQPHLCAAGRAPKQAATPQFAAVANYGYHLDAGKFGAFLKAHCLEKLGVRYLSDHVVGVNSLDNGDIASLQTAAHGPLAGQLFVDCTGMQSMLLGAHYGVPLLSQKHVLFNDSALAVQVPYPQPDSPIASTTAATAQHAGWIWDIGLPTRRGIGHVYSSAHCSDDQAENALRAYILASSGQDDIATPRKIGFSPGYRARFWHRNCVAVGLSSGFIEPLEASALALVEMAAAAISDALPFERAGMDIVARRFNADFTYRWERVIEFLKLHYVLSRRADSDFWIGHRQAESIPERLRELLQLWRHRAPARSDFGSTSEVFPAASYQYILYGMGFEGSASARGRDHAGLADEYFREAAQLAARMLPALPDNRSLLAHIARHGLPSI
ncbi:MAG: tryptophan 7-halogenase [Massilia sp.]|nr:tryptophan 7-halogenase [Massilia sp.]